MSAKTATGSSREAQLRLAVAYCLLAMGCVLALTAGFFYDNLVVWLVVLGVELAAIGGLLFWIRQRAASPQR